MVSPNWMLSVQKSRPHSKTPGSRRRLDPVVLGAATMVAAILLVAIVAIPQYLSKQARFDGLRGQVEEIGRIAASVVDGDLHRALLDPKNYSDELYARALAPLVKFHSSAPDNFYVYTMADRDGVPYFILDTAASAALQTKHELVTSDYMEKFELRKDDDGSWLKDVAAGKAYVSEEFEEDDYGTFLSAHVPHLRQSGPVQRFCRRGFRYGILLGARGALPLHRFCIAGRGRAACPRHRVLCRALSRDLKGRMRELHESSIHDSLTGMFNRRGVMEVMKKILEAHVGKSAVLLIDINNLTTINDTAGHVAGDAILARTAEAIRETLGEDDLCGRLGDDFMVYAPGCDAPGRREDGRAHPDRLVGRGHACGRGSIQRVGRHCGL